MFTTLHEQTGTARSMINRFFRQPDPAPEFREARIGLEALQSLVGIQVDGEHVGALLEGAVEQGEGCVVVAESGVDDGHVVRSDVMLLRHRLQLIEHVLRFGAISRHGVDVAQARPQFGFALQRESVAVRLDRFAPAGFLRARATEIVVVEPIAGIEVDRAAQLAIASSERWVKTGTDPRMPFAPVDNGSTRSICRA